MTLTVSFIISFELLDKFRITSIDPSINGINWKYRWWAIYANSWINTFQSILLSFVKAALIHQRAGFLSLMLDSPSLMIFKIDSLSDWRGYLNLIQDKDTLVTKLSKSAGIFALVGSFSLLILSIPCSTVVTSSVQVVFFFRGKKRIFSCVRTDDKLDRFQYEYG